MNTYLKRLYVGFTGVAGFGAALLPLNAVAQYNGATQVEEVIVTATKREQAVNDIPIAVSAYAGEQLKNSGVRDVSEVVQVNPSIDFGATQNSIGGNLSIRGLGTLGTDPGLESSVGVFIDGVYRSRNSAAIEELGPIERIEVLRGPQGTLFGRNTSAGALNVVTKAPDFDEPDRFIEYEIGSDELRRVELGLSGPLIEGKAAGRLDVIYSARDGLFKDINNPEDDLNDLNRIVVRTQLALNISDTLDARIIADGAARDEICCNENTSLFAAGPQDVRTLALSDPQNQALDNDDPHDEKGAYTRGQQRTDVVDTWGLSAELNWDLGDSSVVSITSYRDTANEIAGDIDASGADLAFYRDSAPRTQRFKTITQELRWQGAWDRGSWLVGAFLLDEEFSGDLTITYGADLDSYARRFVGGDGPYLQLTQNNTFISGQGIDDSGVQNTESAAIFTHNVFDITDTLSATLGLRYSTEEKDLTLDTQSTFQFVPGPAPGGNPCAGAQSSAAAAAMAAPGSAAAQAATAGARAICGIGALTQPLLNNGGTTPATYKTDRRSDDVSGTAGLAWQPTEDSLLYASYSKGIKSGGFNQSRLALAPGAANGDGLEFDTEEADSYEIGYKTYLLDKSLTLNTTVFYSEFSDFQLTSFNGITLSTTSVDKIELEGVEIEAFWRPHADIGISAGATYVDNRYPNDSNIDTVSPVFDTNGNPRSRAGKRRASPVSATASLSWTPQIHDDYRGLFYIVAR